MVVSTNNNKKRVRNRKWIIGRWVINRNSNHINSKIRLTSKTKTRATIEQKQYIYLYICWMVLGMTKTTAYLPPSKYFCDNKLNHKIAFNMRIYRTKKWVTLCIQYNSDTRFLCAISWLILTVCAQPLKCSQENWTIKKKNGRFWKDEKKRSPI